MGWFFHEVITIWSQVITVVVNWAFLDPPPSFPGTLAPTFRFVNTDSPQKGAGQWWTENQNLPMVSGRYKCISSDMILPCSSIQIAGWKKKTPQQNFIHFMNIHEFHFSRQLATTSCFIPVPSLFFHLWRQLCSNHQPAVEVPISSSEGGLGKKWREVSRE